MENISSGFSVRLKEERVRLSLNQEGFGRLGGVGKVAQLNYEKGNRIPTVDYLFSLGASKTGVDVGYLVSGARSVPIKTVDPDLLAGAISLISSIRARYGVRLSDKDLSLLSVAVYRAVAPDGAHELTAEERLKCMDEAAENIFSGWVIGQIKVRESDHP